MNQPEPKSSEPRVRYNPLEVNATGIVIFVALVVVMVAVVLPGVKLLLRHLEIRAAQADRDPAEIAVANSRTNFPAPREQLNAPADLAAFLAQQRVELNSYGWIDRRGGVVRIPITRAMELLSERELLAHSNSSLTGQSILELQQQRAAQTNPPNGGQP